MIDEFMLRAALMGMGLSIAAAPLGCLLIWRRMAFYSDVIAHAALLGVVVAIILGIHPMGPLLLVALTCLLLPQWLGPSLRLPGDAMLSVLSQVALALAILVASWQGEIRRSVLVHEVLFGDILAVTWQDVMLVGVMDVAVLLTVRWWWPLLVLEAVSRDLALAEVGHRHWRVARVLPFLLLMLLVALGLQAVGALLFSAIVVIPAALAGAWARSPEAMAMGAAAVGVVCVVLGLTISYEADTPSGPMIVGTLAVLFMVSAAVRRCRS